MINNADTAWVLVSSALIMLMTPGLAFFYAGFAAIVAAFILGPRSKASADDSTAHNIPYVMLGASLLWFGWFGFNAGSSLAADGLAALAFVTTILAAAASMTSWTALNWIRGKPSSATGSAIAAVIGLVAITPAAGFVTPTSAIVIGIFACVVSYVILSFHLMPSKVDDTLDVFACHWGCGSFRLRSDRYICHQISKPSRC